MFLNMSSVYEEWKAVFGEDAANEVKAIVDYYNPIMNNHLSSGSSLGNVVTLTVNSSYTIVNCTIEPSYLKPENHLLISACVVDAYNKANKLWDEWYQDITKEYENRVLEVRKKYEMRLISESINSDISDTDKKDLLN